MSCDFVLTTCPFCGCGCQFYIQVLDGELVGITPCKSDEISHGKLCIKGRRAFEFVQHKDRLTTPLLKRNGRFEPASWDEAQDIICQNLNRIREGSGPDSIGFLSSAKCTNEENYLLMKFARSVIGTNNIDHCARLCHSPSVVGLASSFGSGAMTNSVPEVETADCFFVIGSNTLEAHPLIGSRIMQAKENGARLIVADPRQIPLVAFADVHVQLKPGSDVALLNGIMNLIISLGLADIDFITKRTEGFEDFKARVSEYTPERVSRITGVDIANLKEAAQLYGKADKGTIIYCMGITQHSCGTDNVRSCANLAMLTGNIGRESTGVNPLRGQNNVQGACDMGALPNVYSAYQAVQDENTRHKFEQAWKGKLPSSPGLTVTEMIDAASRGSLKAIYVMGENPMMSDPDINHVREAFSSLDFLVVQDIFLSETAQLAHVVLPACSFAEKEGTFTATDRRVQRIRKAIEPVGDSQPDWLIISQIAQKMKASGFDYASSEAIMSEIAQLSPSYGGISYERLNNGDILAWPCPTPEHPGTKFLHEETFTRGKGRFFPIDYKEPVELPDDAYPFILTTGRLIFQYHSGTMTRRVAALEKEASTGFIELNPEDAQRLSISQGEKVKVKSRRGEIEIKAFITDRVSSGVVFIPFHFAECAANKLTATSLDPEAKIPEFKVCAVKVYKGE
ncbi:formate dehydrogenase subunit alpha [Chloroflexota bacterium]